MCASTATGASSAGSSTAGTSSTRSTRPSHGAGVGVGDDALSTTQLPEVFDTWHRFWEQAPAGGR